MCNDHGPGLFDAGSAPGVFPASGDGVLGNPVGGAADAVEGILEIRLTKVSHKIN